MPSRRRSLAAPFVVTVAVLPACGKTPDTPPRPSADDAATAPLEYDGYGSCFRVVNGEKAYAECPDDLLPTAPPGRLVYKLADRCSRVPDAQRVRCPPGGPTVLLAESPQVGNVSLRYGTLDCLQSEPSSPCPRGASCNPPPPKVTRCPAAIMPRLAPAIAPTKRDGDRCYYDAVEVVCPAGDAAP